MVDHRHSRGCVHCGHNAVAKEARCRKGANPAHTERGTTTRDVGGWACANGGTGTLAVELGIGTV